MELFPTTFLLGLAGIDPTGAILIISAISIGISKKKIILFITTVLIGTTLVGLISSNLILSNGVEVISNLVNKIPDSIYMIFEFIIGIVLIKWFIERTFIKEKNKNKEKKKESVFTKYLKKGMFFVGILFSISALTDPSFLALITLMGQNTNLIENILASMTWVIISQLPIFIILIAIIFNKHEKLIEYFKTKITTGKKVEKIKKILYITLSIIILVAGILSIAEAIYFYNTNTWLF